MLQSTAMVSGMRVALPFKSGGDSSRAVPQVPMARAAMLDTPATGVKPARMRPTRP